MFTIYGNQSGRFCDGFSRRDFLKIGCLSMAGLYLPNHLAIAKTISATKSVIMIYLPGGPPHLDMFDLKPDAPSDIRGEFRPIKTNVNGIEICEHMPKIASMMDKFTIIRSLNGSKDEHDSHICMSGYSLQEFNQNKAPCMGSVIARIDPQRNTTIPSFIAMQGKAGHMPWADPGDTGFLGLGYQPLKSSGELMQDMVLKDISLNRLAHRKELLRSLDKYKKMSDILSGVNKLSDQSFDLLTSNRVVEALDVTRENPKIRARYGTGRYEPVDDGLPMINDQFLAARRLVEAGVKFVTIGYGRWDYHGANYPQLKNYLPMLDSAVSSLVQDLHDRGLDKDVSVVVWGEFGRTPKINKDGGRDHWPRASFALLAGGGMRHGQVIGSTSRFGEEPDERPIDYKDVFVTLYNQMGIDIINTAVPDMTGRPNYLYSGHEAIKELI